MANSATNLAACSPEGPWGCSLANVNLSGSICPGGMVNAAMPCYSCKMETAQEQRQFLGNLTQVVGSSSGATCATSGASHKVSKPSFWLLLLALILACFSAASAKEVALLPDHAIKKSSYQEAEVYLKTHSVGDGFGAGNQILVEADSSCPLMGSAGLIAGASASSQCLQLAALSGDEGIACFPNGQDSVPAKRVLAKRDTTCNGMYVDSAVPSHSAPKQISSIVDCRGGAAACPISVAVQHTETVSTSLSLNAGGPVSGIDIGATFGTEYSESMSATITEGYNVPVGQAGYLISTFKSTLFKGSFQGCGGVDGAGQANVIRKNGEEKRVAIVTG
ncbi:hypothetical protein NDA11_006282 [Ustilago hordei]|nr:hypothetical protein NDA10_003657 [Ustilago hordei]KAJ1585313.1 hypothetical protein NDA15_005060 [Ustilago hordei]KAJ1587776.1 hypothetical protein NDA12_000622 [Ustilago hordei]KAJ1593233.1 hypothetical protein NDA11_006282 [Ustilago hordei]KAJ1601921.1 hypothetical protein NDA14_007692 [Ustilago hordei]